jgi:hypothetical protein
MKTPIKDPIIEAVFGKLTITFPRDCFGPVRVFIAGQEFPFNRDRSVSALLDQGEAGIGTARFAVTALHDYRLGALSWAQELSQMTGECRVKVTTANGDIELHGCRERQQAFAAVPNQHDPTARITVTSVRYAGPLGALLTALNGKADYGFCLDRVEADAALATIAHLGERPILRGPIASFLAHIDVREEDLVAAA